MHTRVAAHRLDLDAGVVSQRHQAARLRPAPGLYCSIRLVRLARLLDLDIDSEIARRYDFPAAAFEEDVVFGQLAGVVGGEEEPGRHAPSVANSAFRDAD